VGLKLNGTHLLLAYADDVNLLGDNIDPDVITRQGQEFTLPTLQPRHCQQFSIWYHRSTKIECNVAPDLHRQLQGKRTQQTSTLGPDITTATSLLITGQSSKCRFRNGTGSRFYVSPRKLIPQRRSPSTTARLTARPSPLAGDCLIASTWDYAATGENCITRSFVIYTHRQV
jgi:hypothetical protein